MGGQAAAIVNALRIRNGCKRCLIAPGTIAERSVSRVPLRFRDNSPDMYLVETIFE